MASDIEWVSRISGTFLKKVHQLGVILAHAYDSLHLIADERLYFGIIVSFVLAAEDQHGGSGHAFESIPGGVDVAMSIDNVIAIAGAAEQAPGHHQMWLVISVFLSVSRLFLAEARLFLKVIDRFPKLSFMPVVLCLVGLPVR